jgi:hypothetical protein
MEYTLHKAMQEIYNSTAGKWLLDGLVDAYVKPSAVGKTVEETYYTLGRKELIQELMAAKEEQAAIETNNTSEYLDD